MATHSSVLAWRIPGTGKPGGLSSMGSHRVGHDWSDLAAAAAADTTETRSFDPEVLSWNWCLLACTSLQDLIMHAFFFSIFAFSDIMLAYSNWSLQDYLHPQNRQILSVRPPSSNMSLLNILLENHWFKSTIFLLVFFCSISSLFLFPLCLLFCSLRILYNFILSVLWSY